MLQRISFGPVSSYLPLWHMRRTPFTPTSSFRAPTRSASQWPPYPRQRPRYQRFNNTRQLYNLWYTSPGFRYGVGAVGAGGGLFYYYNLERVPVSGRLRFNWVPESIGEKLGEESLRGIMQEFGSRVLPPNHPYSRLVDRVMARLVPASGLDGEKWEVRVIDEPTQKNAFVLPG